MTVLQGTPYSCRHYVVRLLCIASTGPEPLSPLPSGKYNPNLLPVSDVRLSSRPRDGTTIHILLRVMRH